ncbi:hypothetical protein JW826_05810 [Candidatus Woesearchaeota archaeon]|nr:hypothetical protein [Candidatus Woesearchaeota archaeon]
MMGQVSLVLESMRKRFTPGAFFFSLEKAEAREARKQLQEEEKLEIEEKRIVQSFTQQVEEKLIDGVVREYKKLCQVATTELTMESKAIHDVLLTCVQEGQDLSSLLSGEDLPENRQRFVTMLNDFTETAAGFLKQAEQASNSSFKIHTSDQISLRKEVIHVLDPFNLQIILKQLNKTEKALAGLQGKVQVKPGNESDETAKIEAFIKKFSEFKSRIELAYKDILNLMRQKSEEERKALMDLLVHLEHLKFPDCELEPLYRARMATEDKITACFKALIDDTNGLERILMSVDKNKRKRRR